MMYPLSRASETAHGQQPRSAMTSLPGFFMSYPAVAIGGSATPWRQGPPSADRSGLFKKYTASRNRPAQFRRISTSTELLVKKYTASPKRPSGSAFLSR
jgi:hypothetical protein